MEEKTKIEYGPPTKKEIEDFNRKVEKIKQECKKHGIDAEISQDARYLKVKTRTRDMRILKWDIVGGLKIEDYVLKVLKQDEEK